VLQSSPQITGLQIGSLTDGCFSPVETTAP